MFCCDFFLKTPPAPKKESEPEPVADSESEWDVVYCPVDPKPLSPLSVSVTASTSSTSGVSKRSRTN